MEIRDVIKILDPQFGYWAKSNGEQLYAHHFTVWSIFKKLADLCPSLEQGEKEDLELASLVHDVGKMSEENQRRLKNNEGFISHRPEIKQLEDYFQKAGFNLSKERLRRIRDIIHTHHGVAEHDLREIFLPGASFYTNLLRTADHIASMEYISFETLQRIREFYRDKVDFSYFSISRFPSPSTFVFVVNLIKQYEKQGWTLLRTFDNGAILISKPGTSLPNKQDCVNEITREVIEKALSLVSPLPSSYTGDFLTLLSKQYPDIFLQVHKNKIIEALGNIDQRAVVFFKLARDILLARDLIPEKLTNKLLQSEVSNPWILGILEGANSTGSHSKTCKPIYKKFMKSTPPDKVNREMIDPLFDRARIMELVPSEARLPVDPRRRLISFKPIELFEILQAIAQPQEAEPKISELEQYINDCITMDEITDFRKIAETIFERYRDYKRTANAEKGVCERCGSYVAAKMQPALNVPFYPQSSSQIKTKYAYRAVCPLCGLDNIILRSNVRKDERRIYLRIESKIPELLQHHKAIRLLVERVAAGLANPRYIIKLKDSPDFEGLPFPERIEVPVADTTGVKSTEEPILTGDNGILFVIGRNLRDKDYSPKDQKYQYEPLYHIMKYLGFKVALGAEEQEGLFGEEVFTDEKGENYYLSLGTIILASILKKKQKQYVFARNLILNSPSTVLMVIADTKNYADEEKMKFLLKSIKRANAKIVKGGDLTMGELLKDAAFFADRDNGIPHFCIEPEERGNFWRELSKHRAGKPVAQALDAILAGMPFDIVLERFMRNIAHKISKNEQTQLKKFVKRSREILQRYYEIRQSDIGSFLKAKNSLLSAIYIFTRYPDLKEVINE
ncbi:MAG: HD domain-containing protein [candidate division WOR-3 bacterium]